jgi:hypothetical protein
MKRLLAFVTLAAAFVPGCGNVPEAKEYNESLVAAGGATCACNGHALLLFSSEAECRAEFPPSEAEQGCVEALFKSLDPDFGPHLDCRTAANQRYASCLNAKTCTDLARGSCVTELNDELEDCPDFPDEVQADLNDCLN